LEFRKRTPALVNNRSTVPRPSAGEILMQTPYLCSISDAATALGIGRTKTYEMLNSGELESIQIGTRRLVKLDSIKAFIENASGGAA
jgi:excisionase family DNA binding protein